MVTQCVPIFFSCPVYCAIWHTQKLPETAFGCKAVRILLNQLFSLALLLELLKSSLLSDWMFCKTHCLQSHFPRCCTHWPQEGRQALPSQDPQIENRLPCTKLSGRETSEVGTLAGFSCGKCEPHTQHW